MRAGPLLVLLGSMLALGGCASGAGRPGSGSERLDPPVLINRPGPLLHEPSGFAFAETYGSFQRVTAHRRDAGGQDVVVGYNDRSSACLIGARFSVSPSPRRDFTGVPADVAASIERGWLEREFARTRAELEQRHRALESPELGTATAPAARASLRGPSLAFRETGYVSELRLFLFERRWFLGYELRYPEACRDEARRKLEVLLEELPWADA